MKHTFLSLALLVCSMSAIAQSSEERLLARAHELISQMTLQEKCDQLKNVTPAIDRLGIPAYDWWNEGLHGVGRTGRATVFPEPIGLGATFDPDLVEHIGDAVSSEGRAKYGIARRQGNYSRYTGLTYWSPNVNIFRDPRWGRGQETYGEDPLLTGTLGLSYVHGLQGKDPVYLKTSACAKHFAVHSGPEATRHEADVLPSPHDLRETYLPAFEMLVRGGVESVMAAYNSVYGVPCSASSFLLREVLRGDWGFRGHIVSDCGAVDDIYQGHAYRPTAAEACAAAIRGGLNIECGTTFDAMQEALDKGLVTVEEIDAALLPLMMTRLRLGIIDADPACPYNDIPESVIGCEAHTSLALRAAEESMVLLKNTNNLLPLKKDVSRIYLTGEGATEVYNLMGNYYGLSSRYTCYLQGIVGKVSAGTSVDYRPGCMLTAANSNAINWAVGDAAGSPYTIVFLGNNGNLEGEEGEAIASAQAGDRAHLRLPEAQLDYLRRIRQGKHEGLILVLTGGSPIDMTELYDLADAIVMTWYAGQEGGVALANLLFGDANFSGRLPITFPKSVEQLPAFDDYSMRGRTYKYMSDNIFFPFGFGLSYSPIAYSDLTLAAKPKKGAPVRATVRLTNNGTMAADEVLQVYLSAPGAGVSAPYSQLVHFRRVHLLPGESRLVEIEVPADALLTVTEDGHRSLLKGQYMLSVGAASPSVRSSELGVSMQQVGWRF